MVEKEVKRKGSSRCISISMGGREMSKDDNETEAGDIESK